jgi:hypothetical protein
MYEVFITEFLDFVHHLYILNRIQFLDNLSVSDLKWKGGEYLFR